MSLQKQISPFLGQLISVTSVLSATFTMGIFSIGTIAIAKMAQPTTQRSFCTNATLQGLYGLQITGFRLPGTVPFGAVGLHKFDGRGNLSGNGTANIGGVISKFTVEGTYEVNADCTVNVDYPVTFSDGSTRQTSQTGFIVNTGKEIVILETFPNDNVESGTYKKVI